MTKHFAGMLKCDNVLGWVNLQGWEHLIKERMRKREVGCGFEDLLDVRKSREGRLMV